MTAASSELWRSRLNLPAYRVGEAAAYAKISPQTVASWEQTYNNKASVLSTRNTRAGLSFLQLIEIAVVAAMRSEGVKLDRIRAARDFFSAELDVQYPFAEAQFKTDGVEILLDCHSADGELLKDRLVEASSKGQMLWSEMLQKRLREFNYGKRGSVESWRVNGVESEIIIDPKLSFGSPTIMGVRTATIKNRWKLHQSMDDICEDFSMSREDVEDALSFEGISIERPTIH